MVAARLWLQLCMCASLMVMLATGDARPGQPGSGFAGRLAAVAGAPLVALGGGVGGGVGGGEGSGGCGSSILARCSGHQQQEEALVRLSAALRARLEATSGWMDLVFEAGQQRGGPDSVPPVPSAAPCCHLKRSYLSYDSSRGSAVSMRTACATGESQGMAGLRHSAWTGMLAANDSHQLATRLKWIYAMDKETSIEYPALRICDHKSDIRHKSSFLRTRLDVDLMNVILLLDGAATPSNRDLEEAVVKYVAGTLSTEDQVALLAVGPDGFEYPLSSDSCPKRSLKKATAGVLLELNKYSNHVRTGDSVRPERVLGQLTALLDNTDSLRPTSRIEILHIKDMSSLADAEQVAEWASIYHALMKSQNRSMSWTLALMDADDKESNGVAWDMYKARKASVVQDQFRVISINHTSVIGRRIGDYMPDHWTTSSTSLIHVSQPYQDPVDRGSIFAFSRRLSSRPATVVGFEIDAEDFLEDFIYFHRANWRNYPVLLQLREDATFRVLYHPALYQSGSNQEVFALEEIDTDFKGHLMEEISRQAIGNVTISSKHFHGKRHIAWQSLQHKAFKLNTFVVLLVSSGDIYESVMPFMPSSAQSDPVPPVPLVSHHLDLDASSENACRNYHSLGTTEAGSLFLSPCAFSEPYRHMKEEQPHAMNSYIAYITDKSRLIANPGLKNHVRSEVNSLAQLLGLWVRSASLNSDVILRYYAASLGGAFISYPGSLQPANFEPQAEDWFLNALRLQGERMAAVMRLDPQGSGYIVTLSLLQQDRKTVLALDLTLGYFQSLLPGAECAASFGRSCVIFDDKGFIVYAPFMIEPTYVGSVEYQHINQKIPWIGNQLLRHVGFVERKACRNLKHRLLRRYYHYKHTSQTLTNLHSSDDSLDSCLKYQVSSVDGTNLFFLSFNATCQPPSVFCPCNVASSLCIWCEDSSPSLAAEDTESNSCECPCDCPLKTSCEHTGEELAADHVCEFEATSQPVLSLYSSPSLDSLPECYPRDCESLQNETACKLTAGCSWCEVEVSVDPELSTTSFVPLSKPFCAELNVCFGGAVGGHNPYTMHQRGKLLRDRSLSTEGSFSLTSFIGCVLIFLLLLGISGVCYHQRCGPGRAGQTCVNRLNRGRGEDAIRLSSIEVLPEDEDETKEMNAGPAAFNNAVLLEATHMQSSSMVSPYRMNPEYRRPPPGTDSDHGYSTMTPQNFSSKGTASEGATDLESEVIQPCQMPAANFKRDGFMFFNRYRHPRPSSSATSGVSLSSKTSSLSMSLKRSTNANSCRIFLPMSKENTEVEDDEDMEGLDEDEDFSEGKVLSPNQILVTATVHRVDSP